MRLPAVEPPYELTASEASRCTRQEKERRSGNALCLSMESYRVVFPWFVRISRKRTTVRCRAVGSSLTPLS